MSRQGGPTGGSRFRGFKSGHARAEANVCRVKSTTDLRRGMLLEEEDGRSQPGDRTAEGLSPVAEPA
jgi:hypothetical protein